MTGSGGEFALGIDVGTTNVKAVLVAPDGSQRGAATRSLTTATRGDRSTQDPIALWDAVEAAVREAVDASGRSTVNAVGVCSQYSSIVPVDEAGLPTGPMVMWTDTRGSDHCWAIMERHPEAFAVWVERHGIPTVGAGLSLAHLLFMQHDEPETHARTASYLEPMDYVIARLTGRRCATQATMFASQLCDNRNVGTTTYDDELVAMSGVDASKLPPLVALDAEVGPVEPAVARLLGLSSGTPVFAGINDSQAGAFATGAFDRGRLGLMIGTTAVLLDSVGHRDADLDHEIVAMPAPIEGRYLVWAENGVAGRSVEHALELIGGPMAHLDELMAGSAPGAGGVLFLPWLAGSLSPSANRAMRGGFLNVGVETTRADLVRAAVEGTARNLRWLLPHVMAFSGHSPTEIVFGGGAARSAGWAQTIADVLGLPVGVLDAPGFAAARAVGSLATCRRSGDDPTAVNLPIAQRYEPEPATAARHAELQAQFEAAFAATLPICQALNPDQS